MELHRRGLKGASPLGLGGKHLPYAEGTSDYLLGLLGSQAEHTACSYSILSVRSTSEHTAVYSAACSLRPAAWQSRSIYTTMPRHSFLAPSRTPHSPNASTNTRRAVRTPPSECTPSRVPFSLNASHVVQLLPSFFHPLLPFHHGHRDSPLTNPGLRDEDLCYRASFAFDFLFRVGIDPNGD